MWSSTNFSKQETIWTFAPYSTEDKGTILSSCLKILPKHMINNLTSDGYIYLVTT